MSSSDPWSAFHDELTADAPRTGPFPHRGFLEAATRAIDDEGDLAVFSNDESSVALVVGPETVRFAAHESITDYHSPLGTNAVDLLTTAFESLGGRRLELDSLPDESVASVSQALDRLGIVYTTTEHAATGVLTLPSSLDDWLMSIGKKERHEVRRKRRKFEAEHGEIVVERRGIEALDPFCDLHRTSPGDKGSFMTERMQAYFGELITDAGAIIHNLVCDGNTLASAFGFETDDAYYYYNSAYDSRAAQSSPGIVLLSMMISAQIDRGAVVFDFLKGAETYKYRHGAVARPLYVIEGSLP